MEQLPQACKFSFVLGSAPRVPRKSDRRRTILCSMAGTEAVETRPRHRCRPPCARRLDRRDPLQRGRVGGRALPADGRGARSRPTHVRADLRGRRLDGRHVRCPGAPARRRPARARGAVQAQLRPASRDACRACRGRAATSWSTMDGDLQNQPEDIPRLVEAVEAGNDVASGRRRARKDPVGRSLPSRVINGMLRRFTGVAISDFGCAFNAYRREAVEPMLGSIGKQKFTKALILSGGASVIEVDVAHAPRHGQSRYSPLRLTRSRSTFSRVSGRSRSSGSACSSARCRRCSRSRSASTASCSGSASRTSPGPLFGGVAVLFRPRHPGLHPRADRRVPRPHPARRRRPPDLHHRPRALTARSAASRACCAPSSPLRFARRRAGGSIQLTVVAPATVRGSAPHRWSGRSF